MTEAAVAMRQRFQIPVMVAALLVIPVVLIEQRVTSGGLAELAYVVNWAIWAVFVIEYVLVVRLAADRWAYTRSAWLDLLIIFVSFPLLGELLAATRLFRLGRLAQVLRLLRLVRLAAVLTRGGFAFQAIFRTRGLIYVISMLTVLGIAAGAVFAIVEDGGSVGDGLWWAITTLSTVGYGDVSPVTTAGRLAGAGLYAPQ